MLQKRTTLNKRLHNSGLRFHVSCAYFILGWCPVGPVLPHGGEVASLALVGHPSSDGVTIKMTYGVDVLHQPDSDPIFSYWVGSN